VDATTADLLFSAWNGLLAVRCPPPAIRSLCACAEDILSSLKSENVKLARARRAEARLAAGARAAEDLRRGAARLRRGGGAVRRTPRRPRGGGPERGGRRGDVGSAYRTRPVGRRGGGAAAYVAVSGCCSRSRFSLAGPSSTVPSAA